MIRSIHPLYFLGMLIVLLAVLIWQNSRVQEEIAYELAQRSKAKALAKDIVALKKVMETPNTSSLDNFLQGSVFAGAQLSHRIKSGHYIVAAQSMDARQIQTFLNRIFNMSLKVVQFKMQRLDDKHVELYMEVEL